MSTVNNLRNARNAPSSHLTNLITMKSNFQKQNIKTINFFEGIDDKLYYDIRFQSFLKNYYNYELTGKETLLELKKLIKTQTHFNIKTLYYIDSDFDYNLNDENLYCTPVYSIENFYISKTALKKILKSKFNLCEFDCELTNKANYDDFFTIIDLYDKLKMEFLTAITPLMIWYYHQNINKAKLYNFNYILDFVNFSLDTITPKYTFDNLKDLTPNYVEISEDQYNKYFSFFSTKNKEKFFRGKYLFDFFVEFLKKIGTDANLVTPRFFTLKRKNSLANIVEPLQTLSIFSDSPDCLIEFLRKHSNH